MTASSRPAGPAVRRVELWLTDALLGVILFGAVSWMIHADLAGERPPDAMAYSWAFVLGALMLVRRRFPLAVLSVTVVGIFIYYAAGYPAIGLGVPLAGALLSAAQYRRLRWPVLAAAASFLIAYGVRLGQGQDFGRIIGFELVGELGTVAAAIALGFSLRLRLELQDSARRLMHATVEEERARAAAATSEERSAIARELHDSLGHHATVISMHADVIREAVDADPAAVQEAAQVVKDTSREMLRELRSTVRTLREGSASPPDARQLPTLSREYLQTAVFDPLPVQVSADIRMQHQPTPAVQSAVHRILQEALTNVTRHSAASRAEVSLTESPRGLHLTVKDPGPARGPSEAGGYGLCGMRERAEAVGGTLTSGPEGAGFTVEALLPLRGQETPT